MKPTWDNTNSRWIYKIDVGDVTPDEIDLFVEIVRVEIELSIWFPLNHYELKEKYKNAHKEARLNKGKNAKKKSSMDFRL